MDHLTPQQRHKNMAAIHNKNTKPEMIVRKGLWRRGFRYRLNHKRLPGHPDLVLRKYRTCIFINGCFWHGHLVEEQRKLAEMGWHSITVWECELKPKQREQTLDSIAFTLNYIWLQDHGAKSVPYPQQEEEDMKMPKVTPSLSPCEVQDAGFIS